MKQIILSILILFVFTTKGVSQNDSSHQKEKQCYTKQWIDSVNAATIAHFNPVVPNTTIWYAYENQQQQHDLPPNIVNVVYVKLEDECIQKK